MVVTYNAKPGSHLNHHRIPAEFSRYGCSAGALANVNRPIVALIVVVPAILAINRFVAMERRLLTRQKPINDSFFSPWLKLNSRTIVSKRAV
ncbi:hypothetical protein [Marinobacter sp. ELB17]|uniref:hypothetical protein n=1 Tax=Marinobacter sp. ELB17 TaxID=270374 RepID=UPI0000F3A3C2|nr:hypothetical protein [Marinobacter sp. ELB17]EAZ97284.1 hypothetical protein MELB17_09498 [Marinobacter sp. ELB17]